MPTPPCESPFADQVIVVLSSVRSGSTWLVELLGAHPAIGTTKGETWIFHGLLNIWLNLFDPVEGPSSYMDRNDAIAALRRYCDELFATAIARQAPGASWFVEKTPGHAVRLPLMAMTHPDAWYINLIRDGRDVTRSVLRAPWGHDHAGGAAADWKRAVTDVLQNAWRMERFREIRYEDLLVDPVGGATDLLNWMGLDVDAEVEQRIKERVGIEVSRYSSTDPVGTGKWQELPPEALDEIYEVAGDLLVQLGYTNEPFTQSP